MSGSYGDDINRLYCSIQGDSHPICPVMLGDARLANEIADEMLGQLICSVSV